MAGRIFLDQGLPGLEMMSPDGEIMDVDESRPPVLLVKGVDVFHIMHPIGKTSSGVTVYRAAYVAEYIRDYSDKKIQDMFFAVKYVHTSQDPYTFKKLESEVVKNTRFLNFSNFLNISHLFLQGYWYCIVFPFMDLGSVRTIMANRFPGGVPEPIILLTLREALRGLSTIHGCGQVHGEISAGHIFVDASPRIKLAFSASIFDLRVDEDRDSGSPFMPATSIYKWAAAPEVYGSDNNEYTTKADIWMIGITALELAYGGVRVKNREELNNLVRMINQRRRIPEKYEKESDLNMKTTLKHCPSCLNLNPFKKSGNRVFSEGFEDMVASCLDLDQANRPTAADLLLRGIFDGVEYGVFYTYNLFDPEISNVNEILQES